MCPFLHWAVDSLGAEFFKFPKNNRYYPLLDEYSEKIFSHSVGCLEFGDCFLCCAEAL
jgi:hypothetical protein